MRVAGPARGRAARLPRRRTSQPASPPASSTASRTTTRSTSSTSCRRRSTTRRRAHRPYPASICTSVNHVVCHGIPGDKKLKAGDIVNIDVTVIKDGWHGDTSRMFYVGAPSIQAKRLVEVTYEAMWRGIRAVKPGAQLGDIGHTIQKFAEGHRLLDRPRVLRPRHRPAVPRGAAGRPLRPSGHRAQAAAGHDLHDRADDQRRARRASARSPTAGRSSPRTIRCRRSGSTRCS